MLTNYFKLYNLYKQKKLKFIMYLSFNWLIAITTFIILSGKINSYMLGSSNCLISWNCTIDVLSVGPALTISCEQNLDYNTFNLPLEFSPPSNFTSDPILKTVTSIYASKCSVQSFLSNICLYPQLKYLDLSYNSIQIIEHVVNKEDVVIGSSHRVISLAGSVKALSSKDYIGERIS